MKPDDRLEQLQADHELFLQAFEKPTQIYRYLRSRNNLSPIFLQRTLTFMMKTRLSRPNSSSSRRGFKVDSLLERKKKEREQALHPRATNGFMTLTFLGFYDKRRERPLERVGVELLMVKQSHKRRKESSGCLERTALGSSEAPVNPSEDHPPNKAPALSIPSSSFSLAEGHQTRSYTLVVRVHPTPFIQSAHAGAMNGSSVQNGEENLEPSAKRRKLLRGSMDDGKVLSAEMVVYDKHCRCLLTEGEYELVLSESDTNAHTSTNTSPKKNNATWENIALDKTDKTIADQFDVFGCCPTLKFRLSWSSESVGGFVERPRPLMPRDNTQESGFARAMMPGLSDRIGLGGMSSRHRGSGSGHSQRKQAGATAAANLAHLGAHGAAGASGDAAAANGSAAAGGGAISAVERRRLQQKPPRIVYHFQYNSNSGQQTEAREDLHCPWCYLNCMELYALLKHLKLSHPRFLFTYVPIEEGARIDVSVSELYDSTYVGNPQDLISQPPGYAFSRRGPTQRTSITNVLVCKPKRTPHSLSEFLEVDGDGDHLAGPYDGQRPFVTGHNRLYHYSTSNLPMSPHAILQESVEDRVDPPWLMTKICRMIDEFSDVNEGEKDFMKMWNLHVQHYTYVGDCQIPLALRCFIEEKGREVVERNLYRNFVLHCCNLFEFGVVGPAAIFAAVTRMQQFVKELQQANKSTSTAFGFLATADWPNQRTRWMERDGGKRARKDFSGIFPRGDAEKK